VICTAILINDTDVFVTITGNDGEEECCLSPNRWKRLLQRMEWTASPVPPFPVTPDFYDRLIYERDVTAAIRCAARLQSHSPRSKRELLRKLREKGFCGEPAEEAAAFLIKKGYLNEQEQAYAFAENAVTRKRYGKRRISAALAAHGYDNAVIRTVLEKLPKELWEDAIASTLQKKYTPFPTEPSERQKAYAALLRLGFTGGEIQSAIHKAKEKEDG